MFYVYLITLTHGRKIAKGATNCPSMWAESNINELILQLLLFFTHFRVKNNWSDKQTTEHYYYSDTAPAECHAPAT